MPVRPVLFRRPAAPRFPATARRRLTAVGIVGTLASLALIATTASPAGATPVATATFSSDATSSIVALNNLTVLGQSALTATVGPATASIANRTSTATAANLLAALTLVTPAITVPVNQISQTAPPPGAPVTNTLVSVPAAPVLNATALSGTVNATWPAGTACPAAGAIVANGSVTTAAATVIGGLPAPVLSLASLAAATTRSTTSLVAAAGSFDTRAVQARATNNIATVNLLGGATVAGTGITITVNTAPVLTGTASGVVGTSSVNFTPATGTVKIAGAAAVNFTGRVVVPIINLVVGPLTVNGSLTINGAPTGVTNTGTSVSGNASLLSLNLSAALTVAPAIVLASTSLDVAPLHVAATAPVTGIQCAPIPAPTATGINPNQGPTTGGTTVTITGTGFVPGQTTVTICGIVIPVSAVTVVNGTTLTFVTPPHAVGPCPVTVTTPGGTTAPPLTFTYIPVPPVITSPGDGDTTTSTPPIVGTGTPGDTVTVTEGATVICTGVVAANGSWTCTPSTALACGSNTIVSTQALNGTVSGPSNAVTFTVDCSQLAATGTSVTPQVSVGLLLLGIGALLVFGGSRRRRTA